MIKRICEKCGENKELNEINFCSEMYGKNNENVCFARKCKVCQSIDRKLKYIKKPRITKVKPIELTRICNGPCGLEKELNSNNFYWRKDQNEFRKNCINCRTLKDKEYNQKNADKISAKNKKKWIDEKEKCQANSKKSYLNNREKRIIDQKKYYEDNKEEILARDRRYHKDNPEKRRQRYKNRIENDVNFKIREIIRGAIRTALKNNNSSKNNKSINDYLPYTINELKDYIELLFEPWMNWSNWKKYDLKIWDDIDQSTWTWNIDHIIPQSEFYYTSMEDKEFQECWALSNLRPLSAKQNILDGTRRIRHNKKAA